MARLYAMGTALTAIRETTYRQACPWMESQGRPGAPSRDALWLHLDAVLADLEVVLADLREREL
jgi:hypothetical protein